MSPPGQNPHDKRVELVNARQTRNRGRNAGRSAGGSADASDSQTPAADQQQLTKSMAESTIAPRELAPASKVTVPTASTPSSLLSPEDLRARKEAEAPLPKTAAPVKSADPATSGALDTSATLATPAAPVKSVSGVSHPRVPTPEISDIDWSEDDDAFGTKEPSKHSGPENENEETLGFRALEGDEEIVDKLPSNLMYPPNGSNKWLYEDSLQTWHTGQNMADCPPISQFTGGKDKKANIANPVALTFRAGQGSQSLNMGSFSKPKKGTVVDHRYIKMEWITHSQLPGVCFHINSPAGFDPIKVYFYASTIRNVEGRVELTHTIGEEINDGLDKDIGFDFKPEGSGTIWCTTIHAWSDEEVQNHQVSRSSRLKATKPIVAGLPKAELDWIKSRGNELEGNGDLKEMYPHQWVVWGLLSTPIIKVYRTWNNLETGMSAYNFFTKYMDSHLSNVSRWGFWPHYERQADKRGEDLQAQGVDLSVYEPPRNMVKKWRIKKVNGVAIGAQAEQWAEFTLDEVTTYPDSKSLTFAHRLGTERSRTRTRYVLKETLKELEGKISITFLKLSTVNGSYYAEFSLSQQDAPFLADMRREDKPEPGFRISVIITSDGEWLGTKLAGTVTSDILGLGSHLCAVLFARRDAKDIPHDTMLQGTVEIPEDGTPADRQNSAIKEIAGGLSGERDFGVDIPFHVLGAPQTIDVTKTGSLYDRIKDSSAAYDAFESTVNDWSLNEGQQNAAYGTYESEDGLSVIHGPPGCGKTHTIMGIAHALIAAGKVAFNENKSKKNKRKIMVCAGSHAATDNALDTLLKHAKPGSNLSICAFRGARAPQTSSSDDAKGANALMVNANARHELSKSKLGTDLSDAASQTPADIAEAARQESANDALYEYIDSIASSDTSFGDAPHPEHDYSKQRWNFLDAIIKNKKHEFYKTLKALKLSRKKVKENFYGDEELPRINKWIRETDKWFTQQYWDQVDIIFATNSSSAHPILIEHANPNVLISEEAAQATLADMVTPAAAHGATILLWVAAGDHHQQGPPGISQGVNEVFKTVMKPLFQKWAERAFYYMSA